MRCSCYSANVRMIIIRLYRQPISTMIILTFAAYHIHTTSSASLMRRMRCLFLPTVCYSHRALPWKLPSHANWVASVPCS